MLLLTNSNWTTLNEKSERDKRDWISESVCVCERENACSGVQRRYYMYVWNYVCTYVVKYVCLYLCSYVCTYVCTYVAMYISMFIHM